MLRREEEILHKEEGIESFAGRRESFTRRREILRREEGILQKEEGIECFAGRRESFKRRRELNALQGGGNPSQGGGN